MVANGITNGMTNGEVGLKTPWGGLWAKGGWGAVLIVVILAQVAIVLTVGWTLREQTLVYRSLVGVMETRAAADAVDRAAIRAEHRELLVAIREARDATNAFACGWVLGTREARYALQRHIDTCAYLRGFGGLP